MKSCRNFSQQTTRSTPLNHNLMFQCVLYYLGAFGRVWLGNNTVQIGPTQRKSSWHEVASEFFVANAPDPPHWTLNSCFGVFCTIWMHSGPFGCLTKLCAKWANWCKSSCHEVVSEFFATNAPNQPFCTLASCFGVFRTIWVHLGQFIALQHSVQNGPNLCKSSCHKVVSEFLATNAPDAPHWTLSSCFGVFHTIWLPYKTRCKMG